MTDMELNNIVQKIDICQNNREQMLRQVVDVYCNTFNVNDLEPQIVTDQLLKITQNVTLLHNAGINKSDKHLQWVIPKQIDPEQLALYLVMKMENITDVIDNDIDFMRLVWRHGAIGYSRHDIRRVRNEILKIQKTTGKE